MERPVDKISNKLLERNEDFRANYKRARHFQQLILLHKRYEEDALSRRIDNSSRVNYLNDDEYISGLLAKSEKGQPSDGRNFKGERLSLRLPKMESISAENKAIFYTTLPKIPSLPVKTEPIRNKTSIRKASNCRKKLEDQSFFRIKPAFLSEETVFKDIHAIEKVRKSYCKKGMVLPEIGVTHYDKVTLKITQLQVDKENIPTNLQTGCLCKTQMT
jgi:hypothetical protein